MINRYEFVPGIPQPARRIVQSATDVIHVLKQNERIDNLAFKYYNDANLAWVIMSANPDFDNEFDVPAGTEVRIPFPLQRVLDAWQIQNEF